MKKVIAVIAIVLGMSSANPATAQSNGVNGMLLGAGGGALVGQAIGRDTKGTLIGTAVGSVLGYAIGNEMDQGGPRPQSGYRPQSVYRTQVYQPPPVYEPMRVMLRPENRATCRETEMLATIDGRPEKVYGTACWQDGEWVRIADEGPWPGPVITETVVIYDDDDHWRGGHGGHHHGQGHHRPGHGRWDGPGRPDHESRVIYRAGW